MANKTTNYNLTKPLPEEFYDVEVYNNNLDTIDKTLKAKANVGEDGKVSSEQLPEMISVKTYKKTANAGVDFAGDVWIKSPTDVEGKYYQNITLLEKIPETAIILVDVDLSNADADTRAARLEAWNLISANEVEQFTSSIRLWTSEPPTIDIPILIGVVG